MMELQKIFYLYVFPILALLLAWFGQWDMAAAVFAFAVWIKVC